MLPASHSMWHHFFPRRRPACLAADGVWTCCLQFSCSKYLYWISGRFVPQACWRGLCCTGGASGRCDPKSISCCHHLILNFSPIRLVGLLAGPVLYWRRFGALFAKRACCARRDRLAVVTQLAVPIGLVLVALWAGRAYVNAPDEPPLVISM